MLYFLPILMAAADMESHKITEGFYFSTNSSNGFCQGLSKLNDGGVYTLAMILIYSQSSCNGSFLILSLMGLIFYI